MSPVHERYHRGLEKNNPILLPYLWIAIVISAGILIGTFLPTADQFSIIIALLIICTIGFLSPLLFHQLMRFLYPHSKMSEGPFYQMIERISKNEKMKTIPEIWVGNEDTITMHVITDIRRNVIAISGPAKQDILDNSEFGEVLVTWLITNEKQTHLILRHGFYAFLFGLSYFLGLSHVDIIGAISYWISTGQGLIPFVIFLATGVAIKLLKRRNIKRIMKSHGTDPRIAHASVFGGFSDGPSRYNGPLKAPITVGLLTTLLTVGVFIILWETAPWLIPPHPAGHYEISFVMTCIIISLGTISIIPISRVCFFFSRRRLEADEPELRSILSNPTQSGSISVTLSEKETYEIIDKSGQHFIDGYYEIPNSVKDILTAEQLYAFIYAQVCTSKRRMDFMFATIGGLIQFALVVISIGIYAYVRADMYVLGGDLSTALVFLTNLFTLMTLTILTKRRKDDGSENCDRQVYGIREELLDALRALIQSNHHAPAGDILLKTRMEKIDALRGGKK